MVPGVNHVEIDAEDHLDLVRILGGGEPEFAPARTGEIQRSCLDARQASQVLGWTPATAVEDGLPRTYVDCTAPSYATLDGVKAWVRRQPGWGWREIATGHDAMVTAPKELTDLLLRFA